VQDIYADGTVFTLLHNSGGFVIESLICDADVDGFDLIGGGIPRYHRWSH
jgi:hypothetical protein